MAIKLLNQIRSEVLRLQTGWDSDLRPGRGDAPAQLDELEGHAARLGSEASPYWRISVSSGRESARKPRPLGESTRVVTLAEIQGKPAYISECGAPRRPATSELADLDACLVELDDMETNTAADGD